MGLLKNLNNSKLKKITLFIDLYWLFQRVCAWLSRGTTQRAVTRYLASTTVSRLHLGAGNSSPDGWLGTDLAPKSSEILRMSVTAPFPISDRSFDYIFSEHLIEHVSWSDGAFMLKECFRILKPSGTIRIATPDLNILLGLYINGESAASDEYIRWITDNYLNDIKIYRPSFVINNAFRNWGHTFLYDKELLEIALRQAGFVDVISCRYNCSSNDNLRGIELHGKNVGNEKIAGYETMIMEAKKPSA